ncbi:hypothetical protein AOLI_G00305650 [Acnodon oligacanthus]
MSSCEKTLMRERAPIQALLFDTFLWDNIGHYEVSRFTWDSIEGSSRTKTRVLLGENSTQNIRSYSDSINSLPPNCESHSCVQTAKLAAILEERGVSRRRDWRPAGPSHFTSSLAERLKLSDAAWAKTQRGPELRVALAVPRGG